MLTQWSKERQPLTRPWTPELLYMICKTVAKLQLAATALGYGLVYSSMAACWAMRCALEAFTTTEIALLPTRQLERSSAHLHNFP